MVFVLFSYFAWTNTVEEVMQAGLMLIKLTTPGN